MKMESLKNLEKFGDDCVMLSERIEFGSLMKKVT